MKKQILALSVAAAFGGLAGVASAAPVLKASGIGHVNVVPYFTSQGNNVTHLHITNTDTARGKAVKVRFRGAEWSDDLFDFTVFLSPGDVFVGTVGSNASGVSTFKAYDNSCTLPAYVNDGKEYEFSTIRLSGERASGTREGYIEIINMADIVDNTASTTDLFDAIKHVNGVAPCTTAKLAGLVADNPSSGTSNADMVAPTGTLSSWARILDIVNIRAYGMNATAWAYPESTTKQFYRQSDQELTATAAMTTDFIFFGEGSVVGSLVSGYLTKMYQYDMPDLSTPVDTGTGTDGTAATHRDLVAAILQKTNIVSDYATNPDVGGATDIVLNQPMRRYFYTYDSSTSTSTEGVGFSRLIDGDKYNVDGEAGTIYEDLDAPKNEIPLADLGQFAPESGYTAPYVLFDRNEQYPSDPSDIVISPRPPSADIDLSIKGEVAVFSINNNGATTTGALEASLTINDLDTDYKNGWLALSTTSTSGQALPVIGFAAIKVTGNENYGTTLQLGYTVDPAATGLNIGH